MRHFGKVLIVALVFAMPASAQPPNPALELQQLQGRWLVAHRAYTPTVDNKPVANLLESLGTEVEIKDGKLTSLGKGRPTVQLEVEFNPLASPKSVDLRIPGKKKEPPLQGIYLLEEGNILALTVSTTGQRPNGGDNPNTEIRLILRRAR